MLQWLSLEFDPDPPAESEPNEVLDFYVLEDTPENRQRLEQIKADSVTPPMIKRQDSGEEPAARPRAAGDEDAVDNPLAIPAVFRREKTA